MKFTSFTNVPLVGFIQGYIAEKVMTVKDSSECTRFTAFVKKKEKRKYLNIYHPVKIQYWLYNEK